MVRPTFLMAEIEPPEGLSARKLVLETGKFNVITAYSEQEAIELFKAFPGITALILHPAICQEQCSNTIKKIKQAKPEMPVIILTPQENSKFPGADHQISSHEPQELLNLVRSLFGDPRPPDQKKRRT
ncbi:MAG TPA: response regulator [Candidatus Angelobacter sp.]|nr:response regulator [Candidatus Angelobacter sp.]